MRKSRLFAAGLTDDQRRSIASEYAAGEGSPTLSKRYGVSMSFVLHCVTSSGGTIRTGTRTGAKLSREQRDQLVADYQAGISPRKLSAKYGIRQMAAYEIVRRRRLTRAVGGPRSDHFNENAFDEPSEARDYWLGMLMTDGTVSDSGSVTLGLKESDIEHVRAFGDFLGSGKSVTFGTSRERILNDRIIAACKHAKFTACSRRLASSLARFGVVPRKTHIAKVIGLENSAHFWRGAIDGDGTVAIDNRQMPVIHLASASRAFLEQFQVFVRSRIPNCAATIYVQPGCMSIHLTGRFAIQLANLLYGSSTIALARKLATAKEIIDRAKRDPFWCNRLKDPEHWRRLSEMKKQRIAEDPTERDRLAKMSRDNAAAGLITGRPPKPKRRQE